MIGWMKMKIEEIGKILDEIIPNPKCELNYNKDYELLLATVLSAQATDKSVNKVTAVLFKKYNNLKKLKNADIQDLKQIIKPIGTYERKSAYIKEIARILDEEYNGVVPKDRKEAYIKGLMSGFSGDFMTALYILIPQVENSIRELAIQCGEPVYNLNENGIEELKTMHAILELDGVKEKLDDDFLLSLKTIFCSKFGFNMRNNIAHGIFSDKDFNSYEALYTWWFILRMCYMFCGKLQIDNRIKVNEKLKKLFEKKK